MTLEERACFILDHILKTSCESEWVVKKIADQIHLAVLAERERCAKIAETWGDPEYRKLPGWEEVTGCQASLNEGLDCNAITGIAAAIRQEPS